MAQLSGNNKPSWEAQYARLGYFLLASSFLVATFVQLALVTESKGNCTPESINILVHAVAALGSFIAALFFFMNLWAAKPTRPYWIVRFIFGLKSPKEKEWIAKHIPGVKYSGAQLLHTWLVPLFFLLFWLFVWINVTDIFWWAILPTLVFLIACFLFQRLR